MIIVGVNGGGTKTEAISCDEKGKILKKGMSGSSNKDNIGMEAAVKNIKLAVSQVADTEPDMICIALAGINTKKDYDKTYKALSKEYKTLILEHDAFAELYGVARGKPGIIVIAGTGSIVLGYDGKRRYRRCDNGYFLGDEGSGYYIGKEGLKVAAKMLIEDLEKTELVHVIMKHFGFTSGDDLMEWVYSERNTVASVAALSKIVQKCAENGDVHAKAIEEKASSNLGNAALELALELGIKTVHIKGGIVRSDAFYSNFSKILASNGIASKHMKDSSAEGALFIAADKAGITVAPD